MFNKLERISSLYYLAPLFFIILACIWAYAPGLQGGYYFDDPANIVENNLLHIDSLQPAELWQAMWSGQASHLKRPVSMLTFAINYYYFGLDPGAMKIVNLLIHIFNGLALLYLIRIFIKNSAQKYQEPKLLAITSLVVVACWLLHPINLTSVLYVVQRMTSLAALFTILSILCYSLGRQAQLNSSGNWMLILIACPFFGLIALLCKENAVLIPYFILCIELFIFKFCATSKSAQNTIKALVLLSVTIPIALLIAYFTINAGTLAAWHAPRDFTMNERLLTEARVLVWYMQMIVAPNISSMGLLIDEFQLSTSLFQPLSTFLSILFITSLIGTAYVCRKTLPLLSLGISWFFAGHLLESTFIPLELVFEHRNYLPSVGIILAVVALLDFAFKFIQRFKMLRIILPAFWIIAFSFATHGRAEHWESPLSLALIDVENHPTSSRTNVMAGLVYTQAALNAKSENDKLAYAEQADKYFLTAIELDKTGFSSSIGRIVILYLLNKPIEIEYFDTLVDNLENGRVGPSTQSSLLSLIECNIERVCKLPEKYLVSLIEAVLRNPLLPTKDKGSLMVQLGRYYAESLANLDKAEELVKEAIKMDKSTIRYRLPLANWQILNGKYEEAQIQLNIMKQLDTLNMNAYDISKWESFLNDRRKNNNS